VVTITAVFEIGSSLREARMRKGLELTDLEVETKIRGRYLRALEDEEFQALPGDSYVKGFLRTYADRLGLDGQLYVDEYTSRYSLRDEPVTPGRTHRRLRSNRTESHAVMLALVGILAVTVLVIAAWRFGSEDDSTTPTASEPLGTAAPVVGPTVSEVTPPVAPPAADEQPIELLVKAVRGRSKVVVRDSSADGELVWEDTLRKGLSQKFSGVQLWLSVERPGNLDFAIDGERVEGIPGRARVLLLVTKAGVELLPQVP
jgi:hypothetical protein